MKVGKLAAAVAAILGLLGTLGSGLWKVYELAGRLEAAETKAAAAEDRADELEDSTRAARRRLGEAIRSIDEAARERDAVNATAVAVVRNTVDVLHGGTYRPPTPRAEVPRSRAGQIAAAREDADEAVEQAQMTAGEESDEESLADLLDGL